MISCDMGKGAGRVERTSTCSIRFDITFVRRFLQHFCLYWLNLADQPLQGKVLLRCQPNRLSVLEADYPFSLFKNLDDGLCLVAHDDRRDCGWAGIKDWQCQVLI